MRLSIIIPVFRTEATLLRCVHSITQQQFTDWEMLLIDDGSDDNAPQTMRWHAKTRAYKWCIKPMRARGLHATEGWSWHKVNIGFL